MERLTLPYKNFRKLSKLLTNIEMVTTVLAESANIRLRDNRLSEKQKYLILDET